jgi:hypothetical protein
MSQAATGVLRTLSGVSFFVGAAAAFDYFCLYNGEYWKLHDTVYGVVEQSASVLHVAFSKR